MKINLKKEFIRYFEYAGYQIYIYPKREKGQAFEFYLFDSNKKITKETLWIPKSSIENIKDVMNKEQETKDLPEDENVRQLMEDHGIDEDTAEKAQELIDEGLDEDEAVELADEI